MPTQNENYSTIKNVCFKAIKTQKTRITGRHKHIYHCLQTDTLKVEQYTLKIVQYIYEKKNHRHTYRLF